MIVPVPAYHAMLQSTADGGLSITRKRRGNFPLPRGNPLERDQPHAVSTATAHGIQGPPASSHAWSYSDQSSVATRGQSWSSLTNGLSSRSKIHKTGGRLASLYLGQLQAAGGIDNIHTEWHPLSAAAASPLSACNH